MKPTHRFTLPRFAALLLAATSASHAAPDLHSTAPGEGAPDGLCDVWQALYNGWGLAPGGDEDNDGCSNLVESVAGTSPWVPGDCLRVGDTVLSGNQVLFTFRAENGKRYRILSDDSPAGSFATVVTQSAPVNGATEYVPGSDVGAQVIAITKGVGDERKFYRLEASDLDSDGDGVSDWAELSLGLNRLMADSDGNGTPDGQEVAEALSVPDVVSIAASKSSASEDGPDSGTFTVSRSRSFFPLEVDLTLSGTAQAPSDYSANPGSSLSFAVGELSKVIHINPTADAVVEGQESVTATIVSAEATMDDDFNQPEIGNATATVVIGNSTATSGTGLMARYYDNASSTANSMLNFGDTANYAYTRGTPNTTGTILVTPTSGNLTTILNAISVGTPVKIDFTSGTGLNSTAYDNQVYSVTAKTAANFTLGISAAVALPASVSGASIIQVQPIHPGVIERVEATVDQQWMGGTPNGNSISPLNSPDNYSSSWEGYLHPTTASTSGYRFRLDADDKARVLLDLNQNGVFELPGEQVIEHGWDGPATVGNYNTSISYMLTVANNAAQRYKIRVEHVETTGEARCRLQWSVNGGTFANIPQSAVYSHTRAMDANYTYTRTDSTPGAMVGNIVVTHNSHGLPVGTVVKLAFSSGNLFTPANGNFHGSYTISEVLTANTYRVPITGATLPAAGTNGGGFILDLPASTTQAWYNLVYQNTDFSGAPGRVGTNNNGTNDSNNGLYGTGTPDIAIMGVDTFSVRWSGQIQPQFTEDYTISLLADDGVTLRINGQIQEMKLLPSSDSGGSTYNYTSSSGTTVINYSGAVIKAGSIVVGETIRLNPTSNALNYSGGSTYTYDPVTGEMVVTYSGMTNILANGFIVGQTVFLDPTSGRLTDLASLPYVITAATATTYTVNVGAGLFPTSTAALNGNVNTSDTFDLVVTAATPTTFTVTFPPGRHADTPTGNMNIELVNKPLKDWASHGNERYVRLPMVGGTRYDIQIDYYENTGFSRCQLFWFSPSQTKQLIPTERMYPSTGPLAPPVHVSDTNAVALVGGDFSHTIQGSNGGTVSVSGLPAWLTYANGVLSGTPPLGASGTYQILVTITDANGTSESVIDLEVQEAGGSVTREVWTGISGTSVAIIPIGTAPDLTTTLTSLDLPDNAGDNYGTRVRGYITAPATGNYYFWLNSTDTAEFWLSNDHEVVNNFKRTAVIGGSQRSPWMALEQGKRYYFEILHKAGSATADDASLSWSKPGESTSAPTEVVPSYVLTAYTPPAVGSSPGTLYVATMLSQGGAITNGVGTATLRVNEDESVAYVSFDMVGFSNPPYRGLTGIMTDWHVHADPYLTHPSAIIYDGVEPPPGDGLQPDGTHKWTITAVGTLSADDIRELIKQGKAYINIHTAAYPNGEIRGNYTLANGSRTFTPPPPPPAWDDDSNTNEGASRFLAQASYGANIADITALKALTPSSSSGLYPASRYETWIDNQFAIPSTTSLEEVIRTRRADAQGGSQLDETLFFNSWWRNSVSGADQLRQRVAFALSQIHVISGQGPLDNRGEAIAYFYDKLSGGAFGNFRTILETTTLTPAMGRYLDMRNNDKPDMTVGRIPNENFAREIKQLFSVGLYRMWPDGTLMLTSTDSPIDTYTQREIVGYSHVFTGWTDNYTGTRTTLSAPANWLAQMMPVPARHFTGQKRMLNNEVLPGLPTLGNQPLDPFATHNSTHFNQALYQALPMQELDAAHDQLFYHPNTGPFICRQLIQRMVTSHPSRDYLYRVVQKFNDDGSGVRGNMQAVIKAVLLDYEARSTDMISKPAYGKQREPLLRVAAAGRAFRPDTYSGTYTQSGTRTITITTSTPHKRATGNNVMIDFTASPADETAGIPAPWSGTYSVTVVNATQFTINAVNHATGTYSIPANSTVCTVTMSNHWLQVSNQFFMDFTSGAANGVAGLDMAAYVVATNPNATSNGNNGPDFTFTIPAGQVSASARSGNCMIPRFSPGSMRIANSGLPAPNDRRVSMRTNEDHHLRVGDQVQLNVYNTQVAPAPIDVVATVDTIDDLKGYSFLISSALTGWSNGQGNNSVYQFPLLSQPLNRTGSIGSRSSSFQIGNTDGALDQSPVNADTVFNFFLPDYKFPGSLASQGVTTPEFQLTAETGVIRQANYVYDGVFNSSTTNGFSAFNAGNGALSLDYSTWMVDDATELGLGAPTNNTVPWTHNQNIAGLIDRLSTLMTASQLSTGAKTIIRDLVALPITSISTGNPCTVTTTRPHGYSTGQNVCISGVTNGTFTNAVNSSSTARTITVTGPNTFTFPSSCTAAPNASGLTTAHASQIIYNQGSTTPSATERRDRIRAILHLILTSPDFNVQR